jgi:hypothetical protein
MTTEPTQPQAELGPSPANGQGQSQGHRRRRRRRKNKSSHTGAPQAQQGQPPQPQAATAPAAAAPAQAAPPPPQAPAAPPKSQGHQQQSRQGGQAGGRKKKKFFQKGSGAPAPSPGNSISGPPPNKRKNKQRGPREFVGPMDHSYRTVNGNIADGPASTIQITSNGHSNYYPDAYQAPVAVVPMREGAPTRIFCFIEDLFFLAKIQEAARKLGVKVEFVKGDKEVVTRICDTPEGERPRLIVFDLNNANGKPMTLIPKFKTKFKKATSIIGFLSHLQGDLKMKATEAGCDTVMPRSAFSQSLPNLLRRYGMEEEEEYIPQPV